MPVPLPKIVYPTGGGTTLSFVNPPRNTPYKEYSAIRFDNYSSAGVRESIYQRLDEFLSFDMDYVKLGTDIGNWAAFMDYALTGAPFDFYPSAILSDFVTYVLEDTTWTANYKRLAMYGFKVKFRLSI